MIERVSVVLNSLRLVSHGQAKTQGLKITEKECTAFLDTADFRVARISHTKMVVPSPLGQRKLSFFSNETKCL